MMKQITARSEGHSLEGLIQDLVERYDEAVYGGDKALHITGPFYGNILIILLRG
jgi:hypothetical protein